MKTQISIPKLAMATMLVVALVLTSIFYAARNKANKDLDKEKLISEKRLSERILLDEQIARMETRMNALTGKNAQLDQMVADRNRQIQEKVSEINRLLSENASIKTLREKIAELEAIQDKLDRDLNQMTLSYNSMRDENVMLNGMLTSLQNENDILGINIALLKALAADNFRMEALKGKKDKLTVMARRADKLMISFDLPSPVAHELNFKVIDPKGKEVSSKTDKALSVNSVPNNDYLLASSGNYSGQPGSIHTVLTYKPEHKLQKGVYIVKIFNGSDYIGSTQLRLR